MDLSDHGHQADRSSLEMSSDSSVSSDSSDTSDIFEDPLVHPRVGDEYQVEIPPMLSESELVQLKTSYANSEPISASLHSCLMGLPIPVTWVYNHASSVKSEGFAAENTGMDQDSSHQKDATVKLEAPSQTELSNGYSAVPGLPAETWSDFEADCFLLGLYIFGKDLLQVERFMESKDMGQILSYYYGQFWGSARYLKWRECRKIRNKKCIVGHRFLSGCRQQELFSRLLPHLNEESKTKLLEASRAFDEGSTSLVEYVSTLKALVGICALVDAAAIGKGKQDLTTLVMDSKSSQMLPRRSAKACSSLTCAQIVEYLTGDIRLSKTRSNDLFWEAVWPRLLARGWHSEQPRVDVYAGSKNGLVFLMPGVKKFSRRKLNKGDHYFDSVTDVLAKVASQPELLELEGDETIPSLEMNSGDDHDQELYSYFKPGVSSSSSSFSDPNNKFIVVDTSLATESNPLKTREIRSLPLDARRSSNSSSWRKNFNKESSDFHQFRRRIKLGHSSCSVPLTKRRKRGSCIVANVSYVLSLPAQDKNAATTSKKAAPRTIHQQVAGMKDKKVVEEKMNGKITCSFPENATIHELQKLFDLNLPHVSSDTHTSTQQHCNAENPSQNDADVGPSESKDALARSTVVGPSNKDGGSDRQPKRQNDADMGPSRSKDALPRSTVVGPSNKDSGSDQQPKRQNDADIGPSESKDALPKSTVVGPSNKDSGSDQQPKRQSTRNRPLTTKALEALEVSFLSPIRRNRKRSSSTLHDQKQLKRSHQQQQGESLMFPDVIGFQDRPCNTDTDTLAKPPIGNLTLPTELS